MKKCVVCKKEKPLEEFKKKQYYKHRAYYSNSATCKKCRSERRVIQKKNARREFSARGLYKGINKNRFKKKFTKEEFIKWHDKLDNKHCAYCNTSHEKYFKDKIYKKYPGLLTWLKFTLDRKDSLKPYTISNICICCPLCNYVKGFIFNAQDFKKIAEQYIKPLYR